MMRLPFMRCAFALVGMSAGVMTTGASAHAERIISDLEASKLTFASLTAAPPPVVHVHHVAHVASMHRQIASAKIKPTHGMVHLVSYPSKHSALPHAVKRHRT
ncbi:hypothetical protein [Acetobacter cibinongensis]|uniref:Uncharacterized protein n=1 Tax=Acetobacter cibinongensis TaxID=146475 RepID=A0A1Z5YYH8_9PROT|nr:hypothetical protein [Acetobacter cibinongensis]OUJ04317.1 hypothetical protein HK14_10445 [Acetobacter cibinongensis]